MSQNSKEKKRKILIGCLSLGVKIASVSISCLSFKKVLNYDDRMKLMVVDRAIKAVKKPIVERAPASSRTYVRD